jgi:asparagine synthase (glutamine-hydrolysing)
LPSFQENLSTLDLLRRQLACSNSSSELLVDRRYPYLDRDLLEFLYAIPREQLVRPQRRRSLMRRALVGTVPTELLERRRKAFLTRGPMLALSARIPEFVEMTRDMVSGSLGIVNPPAFAYALQKIKTNLEFPIAAILRTLRLESWLRQLKDRDLIRPPVPVKSSHRLGKRTPATNLIMGVRT